jgi:hypothetical protein
VGSLIAEPMTAREFGLVFAKLAMQLRATDVDEATIRSYYEPLADLPLEAVRMAQEAFSREPGRKWFPTSAEWRERASQAQDGLLRKALPPARSQPWRVECEDCEDTGWVFGLTCDGGAEQWPEQGPREAKGNQKFQGNRRKVGYVAVDRATERPTAPVCGYDKPHAPHSCTRACPCRVHNRTYQRHQRFGKGE